MTVTTENRMLTNRERHELIVGRRRIEFQHHGITQSEINLESTSLYLSDKRQAAGPTPEWLRRARGEKVFVPPTAMYVRQCHAQVVPFSASVHSTQGAGSRHSGTLQLPTEVLDWKWCDPNRRNLAMLRAQANAKNQRLNLGELFFTRAQSGAMVVNALNRVVQLAQKMYHARKGDVFDILPGLSFRGGWQASRTFAEVWLEYKYGWLPLYQDAWAAYELLREADRTGSYTAYARGTFQEEASKSWQIFDLQAFGGSRASLECVAQGPIKHRARIDYEIPFDAIGWQRKTGVDNPALLAWELMPWSFFIDWWLPMGTYFEALGYWHGLSFRGAYASSRASIVLTARKLRQTTGSGAVGPTLLDFSTADSAVEEYERIRYTGFPAVQLPAALKQGLGTADRIGTGLALFRTLFGT